MIRYNRNGKEYKITAIAYNNYIIRSTALSNYIINLIISCFSGNKWDGNLPWVNNEKWNSKK